MTVSLTARFLYHADMMLAWPRERKFVYYALFFQHKVDCNHLTPNDQSFLPHFLDVGVNIIC